MSKLLPTFPELSTALGTLSVRQDLLQHAVSVYIVDWMLWDQDTDQIQISRNLIHFVQPDGEIVGVKIFSGGAGA